MLAWGRQENESTRAFEAFELYRDLGAERSLAKVGRQLGKSRALIERWSSRHSWVDRVAALEARDQMLRHEAVEEHLRAKAADHAARETALTEQALEAREKAMRKALAMLDWPLAEQSRRVEGPDGEETVYEFKPVRWTLATAVQLYAMSRNHAGLTEDQLAAVGTLDFSALSEGEMLALIELQDKIEVRPPER